MGLHRSNHLLVSLSGCGWEKTYNVGNDERRGKEGWMGRMEFSLEESEKE